MRKTVTTTTTTVTTEPIPQNPVSRNGLGGRPVAVGVPARQGVSDVRVPFRSDVVVNQNLQAQESGFQARKIKKGRVPQPVGQTQVRPAQQNARMPNVIFSNRRGN